MKTTFLVLLGAALLALPGATAGTDAAACLNPVAAAAEAALGFTLRPWEEPIAMAVTQPVPTCPTSPLCAGGCIGSNPCTFTDTGLRCCLDSALTQQCCPPGKTVFAVTCPCAGGSCSPSTVTTAHCF